MSGPERLDHFMARANAAYYAGPDPLAARLRAEVPQWREVVTRGNITAE